MQRMTRVGSFMRSQAFRRRLRTAAIIPAIVAGLAITGSGLTASATPADSGTAVAASTASITRVEAITDRQVRVFVDSPAMEAEVQVQVLLPRDTSIPRPTIYMLDGRSATAGTNNWIEQGDAVQFFEDKAVNAVITTGGRASYYTDWQRTDPVLGRMKWETFLTKELPPLIDARFKGNGVQSIAGLSMGAQSVMMLAFRNPELYSGVAAYSGCYETDSELGRLQMGLIIASYDGDINNMWGPLGTADWAAHDVFRHAEKLRGKDIYVSTATGLPGQFETLQTPELLNRVIVGGALEAVSYQCTRQLENKFNQVGVDATFVYNDVGVHSWDYWRTELPKSWPLLSNSMGL